MILSMTGYGKSERISSDYTLSIEVRSLNSKYFDCQIKIPKEISAMEIELRKIIEQRLERGKISVTIDLVFKAVNPGIELVNENLFTSYYSVLRNLADKLNDQTADIFKTALYLPDVINPSLNKIDKELITIIEEVLIEAVDSCLDYRIEEGKKLAAVMNENIFNINENLQQIEVLDPERIDQVRERINKNIKDLIPKESFDENRFEQELIYYIEKLDINEEKVRLKSNLEYFLKVMDAEESSGKKLNFIGQEIGREINTIGSKAAYAPIQRHVISMKEELEKIKEQLLNIL
jgi:uncharacterized protein (TIGR00255 family)